MVKTLLYGILLGIIGYALFLWKRAGEKMFSQPASSTPKVSHRYRPRPTRDPWAQVYETASVEEAYMIQARFQEEEVDCVLYEQGKKDLQGQCLKGIGIAVPKSSLPLAQKIISRMPV